MQLSTKINLAFQFQNIPLKAIREHIPERAGNRSSKSLQTLITIATIPNQTATFLKKYLKSYGRSVDHCIKQLIELQLIAPKKRPYWVNAINAWRIDNVFIITEKGLRVLDFCFKNIGENTDNIEITQA